MLIKAYGVTSDMNLLQTIRKMPSAIAEMNQPMRIAQKSKIKLSKVPLINTAIDTRNAFQRPNSAAVEPRRVPIV